MRNFVNGFLTHSSRSRRLDRSNFRCSSPVVEGLRTQKHTRTPENRLRDTKIEKKMELKTWTNQSIIRLHIFAEKLEKPQSGMLVVVRILRSKHVSTLNHLYPLHLEQLRPKKGLFRVGFIDLFPRNFTNGFLTRASKSSRLGHFDF